VPADAHDLVRRTQKLVAGVVRATQESWRVGELEERLLALEQRLRAA
jgi:hypothetical protein